MLTFHQGFDLSLELLFMKKILTQCALIAVLLLPGFTVYAAAATTDLVSANSSQGLIPKKVFDLTFGPIKEMSGIVKSKRFEDVYWVHNDSGDQPRIFAVTGKGKVIYPAFLPVYGEDHEEGKSQWQGHKILIAANYDWEDIAVDDEMLYLSEMGNNGNARRDLGIYVVPEPNPRAVDATRILKFLPVRYPDQKSFPANDWRYDSEAIFIFKQKLYLITKHRETGQIGTFKKGAVLYRLDTQYTDRFNLLRRIESHKEMVAVTGADLSPNGNRLAVLCYQQLWIFEKPRRGDKFFSAKTYKMDLDLALTHQAESITWVDDETIWLGNEGGEVFSVAAKEIPRYRK